jgi:hypothetical protein
MWPCSLPPGTDPREELTGSVTPPVVWGCAPSVEMCAQKYNVWDGLLGKPQSKREGGSPASGDSLRRTFRRGAVSLEKQFAALGRQNMTLPVMVRSGLPSAHADGDNDPTNWVPRFAVMPSLIMARPDRDPEENSHRGLRVFCSNRLRMPFQHFPAWNGSGGPVSPKGRTDSPPVVPCEQSANLLGVEGVSGDHLSHGCLDAFMVPPGIQLSDGGRAFQAQAVGMARARRVSDPLLHIQRHLPHEPGGGVATVGQARWATPPIEQGWCAPVIRTT